jgi:hypothetical protein
MLLSLIFVHYLQQFARFVDSGDLFYYHQVARGQFRSKEEKLCASDEALP